MRGYFGIGILNGKTVSNLGVLWRSANVFGAGFIFTIGDRYKKQCSDTMNTPKHIPLLHFKDFSDFYEHLPYDCQLIGIELDKKSEGIKEFAHPERCVYLLGAEDNGLTREARDKCHKLVQLPGDFCLNVSVAGSIVMHDRTMKGG